ncbi:proton-conducting transporter membrane subunit [Methylogaea oryzae]|uniref:proton-conducting transporter transmembrane domain-containing protein n=1 Tax=Methylogaea oryzae TaxID=1295382 RepID=UPI000B1F601F|nr:proton-conducting transporter membrane subunit [Methylogaea oryzae]
MWVIFSVIVRYCRYYLHREAGYKRFFLTIFAFVLGLNMVVLSGSLDVLFAGWEIVGIASFLLIAFYRHRVQPIRNALRAYSIYRFCDIGLLLGAWFSHQILHGGNHFAELAQLFGNDTVLPANLTALFVLSWFITIAACGKSAQFPFCFWLPRAMEGPTPSSAIFYGALSVHLGVFLLLRTLPIWGFMFITRLMVFVIGLLTVIVAALSEKAQSSIKGQIAYASIGQVGFMFMELALGLESLVLLHFLGNASCVAISCWCRPLSSPTCCASKAPPTRASMSGAIPWRNGCRCPCAIPCPRCCGTRYRFSRCRNATWRGWSGRRCGIL